MVLYPKSISPATTAPATAAVDKSRNRVAQRGRYLRLAPGTARSLAGRVAAIRAVLR